MSQLSSPGLGSSIPILNSTGVFEAEKRKNSIAVVPLAERASASLSSAASPETVAPLTYLAEADPKKVQEKIACTFHQVAKNLAPLLLAAQEEKMLPQLVVFNEEKGCIEFEENAPEPPVSDETETLFKTVHPAHEKAKEVVIAEFTTLYGEAAVSALYPKEERAEPLTITRCEALRAACVALVDAAVAACKGDLSKYDSCLAEQLKIVQEIQKTVAQPRSATPEEASYVALMSQKTGIPASLLYAGILVGGVVATATLTPGLALPVAFHAAMATVSTHTSVLGAALHMGSGSSPLMAAVGGGTTNAAAIAHANALADGIIIGLGAGGIVGAAVGATTDRPGNVLIGAGVGMIGGMMTGLLAVSYSPVVLSGLFQLINGAGSTLNNLFVGAQSLPVTPMSVGAIAGGSVALTSEILTARREERPLSGRELVENTAVGVTTGVLLGGLSSLVNPLTTAGVGGALQFSREVVANQSVPHDQEESSRGARRIAAAALTSGLFGGLCSAIAQGVVTAGISPATTYLGVATGSAAVTGLTETLSRPPEVVLTAEVPNIYAEVSYTERAGSYQNNGVLPVAVPVDGRNLN